MDERDASDEILNDTPCISPDVEKRCLGNIAQTCQNVNGRKVFRSVQDCNATSAGGNFVQMCQRSTGQCCTPGLRHSGNCQ
jgi:hypothetical protein